MQNNNFFQDNLNLLSCGYCLESAFKYEVHKHHCIRIFQEYFIDESEGNFWGYEDGEGVYELSQEQEEQISILIAQKENEPTNVQKKKAKRQTASQKSIATVKSILDQEEQLILEVQKRPPLWNFTLPLKERSKTIKQKLWDEVSEEMEGWYSPTGAQKKFKSLTDSFRRIVRNEKCPSGSARKNSSCQWPHYHSIQFLRDYLNPRQTSSNCDFSNDGSSSASESLQVNDSNLPCSRSNKPRNRKRSSSENEMLCQSFDKVAEAISTSSNNQIVLPPPPEMTEIDACLGVVASRLKKVPAIYQSEAIQDVINHSMEVLKKYMD